MYNLADISGYLIFMCINKPMIFCNQIRNFHGIMFIECNDEAFDYFLMHRNIHVDFRMQI